MNEVNSRMDTAQNKIFILNSGLLITILVTLILKFHLIFRLKIGWDEFLYLSRIYSYLQGTLTNKFQTFYVHFFTWLPNISNNEVTQILAARLVLYLFFVGTCVYIYLLGRQFLNRSGSLFSVLCYLSLSNIIVHGCSFRADSICSFLFIFSVYVIIKKNSVTFPAVLGGLAMAISLMVTIKTSFHLLTIGLILIFLFALAKAKKQIIYQIIIFFLAFLTMFFLLYTFHAFSLNVPGKEKVVQFIEQAGSKAIIFNDFFPRYPYFRDTLFKNFCIWMLFISGVMFIVLELFQQQKIFASKKMLLLTFLVPVMTLTFYKNGFPYYYVFIMAPAIVFCGVFIDKEIEDFKKNGSIGLLVLVVSLLIIVFSGFIFHYYKKVPNKEIASQKELIEEVHKMFPTPVPYIDGCSAISSFPKKGLFMSVWGMENYLEANKPIMRNILIQSQPLFILVNVPSLDFTLPRENSFTSINKGLMEEDWNVLNSNFVHHWGLISVAGKKFKLDQQDVLINFEMLISGVYTIEADKPIYIDGEVYEPGTVIDLKKGTHTIFSKGVSTEVILRWGDHLYRLPEEPLSNPIFYGF